MPNSCIREKHIFLRSGNDPKEGLGSPPRKGERRLAGAFRGQPSSGACPLGGRFACPGHVWVWEKLSAGLAAPLRGFGAPICRGDWVVISFHGNPLTASKRYVGCVGVAHFQSCFYST